MAFLTEEHERVLMMNMPFLSQFDSDEHDSTHSDISAYRYFRIDSLVGYLHCKHSDENDFSFVRPLNSTAPELLQAKLIKQFFRNFYT